MTAVDRCGRDLLRVEFWLCQKSISINSDNVTFCVRNPAGGLMTKPLSAYDAHELKKRLKEQLNQTRDIDELALFIATSVDDCTLNTRPAQQPVPYSLKELSLRAMRLWAALVALQKALGMNSSFEPTDWRPYRLIVWDPRILEEIRVCNKEYEAQLEQMASDWLDDNLEPVPIPDDWAESEKLPY